MKNKPLVTSEIILLSLAVLACVAYVMQFFIDDSSDNIAAASIALTGSLIALGYFRLSSAFSTHPISTFTIFGFCANTLLGSLIVQSAMLNSISQYLRQPIETFAILCLFLCIAIVAHISYRMFSGSGIRQGDAGTGFGMRAVLARLQVYAVPTVHQLWVIGFVGLIGLLSTGSAGHQNVGNKVSAGMAFMAWAPFLIPIYVAQFGRQYCHVKWHYAMLGIFAILISLIGIAANVRAIIVAGATAVGMIALLTGLRSDHAATPRQIMQVVGLLALCVALLIPLSRLATAMVLVRGQRATTSPVQMVSATIDALSKQQLLDKELNRDKFDSRFRPYDEYYVANPVLARFVNTKFHDNSLYFESKLNDRAEDELADTTIDLFWTILPDVVLKYFDIKIAKKKMEFSMGDYLYHQATGGALGGYKYGSIFAHGIGLFGRFFTLVYFCICLLSFWILDLLTRRDKNGKVLVSVVGILLMWRLFLYGITSESINNTFGFLFREIPQSILLFVLTYQLARFISFPLTAMNRLGRQNAPSGMVK